MGYFCKKNSGVEKMIFFDCERLKHPNTGLYHYTRQLANALARQHDSLGDNELCFYVPDDKKHLLDPSVKTRSVGPFDRAFLFDSRISLWHTSSQLSRYQPLNGKKILTIHDLNFMYEPLTEAQKRRRLGILRKNLRRASVIVAISEYTKTDIQKYLDTGDIPIEVIYNGCNRYEGEIAAPAQRPQSKFIFAVGTVLPKKNFHVLPALLRGNDYRLVIAGIYDSREYVGRIMEEAARFGVSDRVSLPGAVSEAEKHWYLRNCEAFVHPSIAEGFGLPVIEAMQYGKPVFISDHTSLPEVGGDVAYYFNHDFDPDAMLREFEAGMADFGTGSVNPESVRARALSFSWDEAARRHIELYRRVLGQ